MGEETFGVVAPSKAYLSMSTLYIVLLTMTESIIVKVISEYCNA